MKKNNRILIRLLPLLILTTTIVVLNAQTTKRVYPNDARISYGGSLHLVRMNDSILMNRHTAELFKKPETFIIESKANTTTGITITFSTNSKHTKLLFTLRSNVDQREPFFAIYKNDEWLKTVKTVAPILDNSSEKTVTWKVYLPIFSGLTFHGIEIDADAKLDPTKNDKSKVYVSIGNSITHGVGQSDVSSDCTYPALLAKAKGWQLYNLAVGGSRISPAIADEFDELKVDVITVLWGYNDWNQAIDPISVVGERYHRLLIKLRAKHPESSIYCILPTVTTTKKIATSTQYSELRELETDAINSIVNMGDEKLFTIDGLALTSKEDLVGNVHLTTDGAKIFAKKLANSIK